MAIERLISLFEKKFRLSPESISPLPGAGSNRSYFRLRTGDVAAIGCVGTSVAENVRFLAYDSFFRERMTAMPEIYAVSDNSMEYLLQDLGDTSLFSILRTDDAPRLVADVMRSLARLQTLEGASDMASEYIPPFGKRLVGFDLNYFKYAFLKPSGLEFDENALQDEFDALVGELTDVSPRMWGFMYRDCQSRNVMIHQGRPWWIDFQGGMAGPCTYDVASFLWQARAQFPDDFRDEMIQIYIDEILRYRGGDVSDWKRSIRLMASLRTLQVLGAYGFRGLVERKSHFVESIPGALRNLASLLPEFDKYPLLKGLCRQLCDLKRFAPATADGRLCVQVYSFSYKRGYPEDFSGNGGGFMFDCRAMHNPGRYEEYRSLTGMDRAVIDFLEERGEVQRFLSDVIPPVERAVERYCSRGFTSLQVGFGCTGGRHRSVYCAGKLAEYIAAKFPDVKVILIHREQGVTKIYNNDMHSSEK